MYTSFIMHTPVYIMLSISFIAFKSIFALIAICIIAAVTFDAHERRRISTASMTTSVSQNIGNSTPGIVHVQPEVVRVQPPSQSSATLVPAAAIPPIPVPTSHKPSTQSQKSTESLAGAVYDYMSFLPC